MSAPGGITRGSTVVEMTLDVSEKRIERVNVRLANFMLSGGCRFETLHRAFNLELELLKAFMLGSFVF